MHLSPLGLDERSKGRERIFVVEGEMCFLFLGDPRVRE